MRGPHRGGDLIGIRVFQEVAGSTGVEGRANSLLVAERGEGDDGHVVIPRQDLPGCLDPVEWFHLQVHQDDIGPPVLRVEARDRVESLRSALDVPD